MDNLHLLLILLILVVLSVLVWLILQTYVWASSLLSLASGELPADTSNLQSAVKSANGLFEKLLGLFIS
jgi:hypothetical protein